MALAGICDGLAQDFGEVVPVAVGQGQQQQQQETDNQQTRQGNGGTAAAAACGLSGLADRAVGSAGEGCCVPKTKKSLG